MPRIPQNTTDCVVFLYESKDDALSRRNPQGTGSIVCCPSQVSNHPLHAHFYVITNCHVSISPKGRSAPASVVCLNLKNAQPDPIELDPVLDWQFEPGGDDIAIAPIEIDFDRHRVSCIPTHMFADEKWISDNKIGFGDDVFMLGLFLDDSGVGIELPKARFGNISAMPSRHTQIKQVNGSTHPSIIIDMHSRGGHSGSPVFVYRTLGANLDMANTPNIGLSEGTLFKFLGVHWGQFLETLQLQSGQEVTGWSGMTSAIPAWRLERVLNLPSIKRHRAEREKQQFNDRSIRHSAVSESSPPFDGANPSY
jgi:hypothetical protein